MSETRLVALDALIRGLLMDDFGQRFGALKRHGTVYEYASSSG